MVIDGVQGSEISQDSTKKYYPIYGSDMRRTSCVIIGFDFEYFCIQNFDARKELPTLSNEIHVLVITKFDRYIKIYQ